MLNEKQIAIPKLSDGERTGVAAEIEKQRDELLAINEAMANELQNFTRLFWLSLFNRGPLRVNPEELKSWDGENRVLCKCNDPNAHGKFIFKAKMVKPESVIIPFQTKPNE